MFNTGHIGGGYSYDTLSLTSEKCFNVKQTTITSSTSDTGMNRLYSH